LEIDEANALVKFAGRFRAELGRGSEERRRECRGEDHLNFGSSAGDTDVHEVVRVPIEE
jgi:hypothetical protein